MVGDSNVELMIFWVFRVIKISMNLLVFFYKYGSMIGFVICCLFCDN